MYIYDKELKIDSSNQLLNDANKHVTVFNARERRVSSLKFKPYRYTSTDLKGESVNMCIQAENLLMKRNERKWIFLASEK